MLTTGRDIKELPTTILEQLTNRLTDSNANNHLLVSRVSSIANKLEAEENKVADDQKERSKIISNGALSKIEDLIIEYNKHQEWLNNAVSKLERLL